MVHTVSEQAAKSRLTNLRPQQVAAIARMDYTSKEATKTLISLAEASWQDVRRRPAFRRFFSSPPSSGKA